ncbi:hypothetical protein [Tissierella pigra]|uniref:Uncharacterized protein n=1 Tax=Tissierella pigra TaxID=2607614 RepID=A0A6N7XH84_9FIRM|nr:hypothetical protein [Tissierella pigra]MSU01389.1 hypothetical protein [Tissierella pigra]
MSKLLGENKELYQAILDDITDRTNGEWDRMSATERLAVVMIMKEFKKSIDRYMQQEYYKIKMWASLDVDDILLDVKEPDLTRWKDNSFQEQFEKLMRGN